MDKGSLVTLAVIAASLAALLAGKLDADAFLGVLIGTGLKTPQLPQRSEERSPEA